MVDKSSNPKQLSNAKQEALVARVEKRVPRFPQNAERAALEKKWLRNYHYSNGKHFIKWNSGTGTYERDRADKFRREYIANLIKPTVRRTVAKLVGSLPIPRVAPETDDVKDRAASKLGEKALAHLWDTVNFQTVAERVTTHTAVCGTGFYKVWWNQDAGPDVTFFLDESGNPINTAIDEQTKQDLVSKGQVAKMPAGDVSIDYVSPFRVVVDPDITSGNFEDARYVCELTIQRKSRLVENFGGKAEKIPYDDSADLGLLSEQLKSESSSGLTVSTDNESTDNEDPKVLVKEYWERPSKEYPDGLHLVIAGDQVLAYGPNFYAQVGLSFPYIPQHWDPDPERFWSSGLVEQLLPIQEEYNRARSQVIENKDLMSKPNWLVPKGSDLPESAFTSKPGEILEYNPNFPPPQQAPPAALPAYVSEHIDRCINEFQIVAADRDPTQAKSPSSLRSGVAINLLDERDRSTLSATMSSIQTGIKGVARASLVLMGELYDEPRLIKTSGENYTYEVASFLGSDLKRNYDVRVYIESGQGESKAGRQQAVLDYVQLGILNPMDPQDKRVIIKALEYGDPQDYISEMIQDERRAEIENEKLRMGMQAEVYPWDDHEVHVKVHRRYMKTEGFSRLNPEIKQLFMEHLGQHDQYLAQQAEAQLRAMSMTRGGPGEKGTPSQPKQQMPPS